jgi:putative endonuclease
MSRWHVYIVRCSDGSLYTGITVDVKTQVAAHNAGLSLKSWSSSRVGRTIRFQFMTEPWK